MFIIVKDFVIYNADTISRDEDEDEIITFMNFDFFIGNSWFKLKL